MAGLPPHATEKEIVEFIGSHYGADIAAFLRIPELRNVIIKAAQNDWGEALVSTALRRTPWYRQRSESMRTMDALKVADPQEYKRLVDQKYASFQAQMTSLGLKPSRSMAETFLRFGFDENQIRENFANKLASQSATEGLEWGGQPKAQADELMRIARQEYLTPVDRQTAERWAVRAFRTGEDIETVWRSYLAGIAAPRFGIDATSGVTPADVMAPVRMAIAENLELDPEAIDFTSRQYGDVLQVETSDGRYRPMTAHEATTWARSQDQFRNTQIAEDETATVAQTLAKTFGKIA